MPSRMSRADFTSAHQLTDLDKFHLQNWALSLIDARPLKEGDGKGADRGVDGLPYFYESDDEQRKILVQVKGGGVERGDAASRDFSATGTIRKRRAEFSSRWKSPSPRCA